MRFVLAIVSFVLAAVMIGYGIAQRTILAEPDAVALSTTVTTDAAVTVIDGVSLNEFDGSQTLSINGSDQVFAAYGRTSDVLAWVGAADYNSVTFDSATGELTSELVRGGESEVPDPNGSDLWLDDFVSDRELTLTVNVPEDVSFLIVSDGVQPAPARLAVSWPLDNSTPWSGPLIVGGAIVLLLGLGFLLWATNQMRRAGGPRRKSPKMPKVPRGPRYRPSRKAVERTTSGRRSMIAVPVLLVGTLALSGCSAEFWPDLSAGAPAVVPTSSASADPAAEGAPPAATVRQVERIVAQISAVAGEADAAKNGDLLATRFTDSALELRLANYAIQTGDAALGGLPPIPEGPVELTLPQQSDTWPRTVFAIIENGTDTTIPPLALFLVQEDPRSNYKVSYAMTLEQTIPPVAPADLGTGQLLEGSPLLRLTPDELALGYADILEQDANSPSYDQFEPEGDTLRQAVGLAKKEADRAALPATASLTFGHELGPADPIVFATNDAGAIVAVNLYETTTVAPVEEGAAVNPTGQVKALSGVAVSTKGVVATYSDQLLFYVPPVGSDAKIVLLGYSQGLVKASEIG